MHVPKIITAALVAIALVGVVHPSEPNPHVHAQSDLVAALTCKDRGYRFMVHLGKQDVLCLETNIGIAKQFVVLDVQHVLTGER